MISFLFSSVPVRVVVSNVLSPHGEWWVLTSVRDRETYLGIRCCADVALKSLGQLDVEQYTTGTLTPQSWTNVPLGWSAFEQLVVQFRAGCEYAHTRRVLVGPLSCQHFVIHCWVYPWSLHMQLLAPDLLEQGLQRDERCRCFSTLCRWWNGGSGLL